MEGVQGSVLGKCLLTEFTNPLGGFSGEVGGTWEPQVPGLIFRSADHCMACSGTISPTSPRAHAVLPSGHLRGKHAQSCVCGRIPGLDRGIRGTSNSLRLASVVGGGARGSHPESRTSTGCSLLSLLLRPLVQEPLPLFFSLL